LVKGRVGLDFEGGFQYNTGWFDDWQVSEGTSLRKLNVFRKAANKSMISKMLLRKIFDRLLLIFTAFVCLVVLTAINLYFGFGLHIHKSTIMFFMSVVLYIFITFFLAIKKIEH